MDTLKKKRNVIRSQAACFTNDAGKLLSSTSAFDLEEILSSATKVERVTGWIVLFLKNIRTTDRTVGPLTAEEIEHARVYSLERALSSASALEFERNGSG
ncbi:hypothetical protein HPB50_014501 [Hyalomma asiaticum]|uniref:Uncharacterized protein n=1 Tax=Hyalomma asiaticum TaxID=266040 RepID=A0ACB7SDZ2_HYAAI|nr:hypothetical protein HPB50_014501 [Hyalomma asiaticum]